MTDAPTPPEDEPGSSPEPTPPPAYPGYPSYPASQNPYPGTDYPSQGYPGQPGAGGSMYGGALPPTTYAHWGQRVAATIIDALVSLPAIIVIIVGAVIMGTSVTTTQYLDGHTETTVTNQGGFTTGIIVLILGYVLAIGIGIWNQIFRQGRTGWSIGKQVMEIRLVNMHTGQPIGAALCFVRQIVHVLDGLLCYIGYLWPLWDPKRQTFADKIMTTVEIPSKKPKA